MVSGNTRFWLLVALATSACTLGNPDSGTDPGGDQADAGNSGDQCVPFDRIGCNNGNPTYFDSCGQAQEEIAECLAAQVCVDGQGACCDAAPTAGLVPAYPWPLQVFWGFETPGAEVVLEAELVADPGSEFSLSLDTSMRIDGNLFYFSFENWLPPDPDGGSTKGIRLYRVGTSSLDEIRASESADIEQGLVGDGEVRLVYRHAWSTGNYRIRLLRAEAQGEADWFDLYITIPGQPELNAGGILAPRAAPGTPATARDISSWYKTTNFEWNDYPALASGVTATYDLISTIDARIAVTVDGAAPATTRTSYGRDDGDREWLNTEATRDGDRVRMWFGPTAARCTPAGLL